MVDERDDRYEGEEGEYHFSDDQGSYDAEPEAPKTTQAPVSEKESLFAKFSKITPRRRAMIAGIVFIVLIGLVYKMLVPSSSEVPTEFAPPPAKTTVTTATTTARPTTVAEQPVAQPISQPNYAAPVTPTPPAAPVQTVTQQQVTVPEESTKNLSDKLAFLEQQNAAVMNLLQTEYAQKMSDYEMQTNLTRGKLDEMSKRVNRIEATLNQITQLLQDGMTKPQGVAAGPRHSGKAEPKMIYSVQAIIPGRAWLKSDSGDTVTVAEGDILKHFGRITKIDPYDGIVEIDTGNRVITLSYGISVE